MKFEKSKKRDVRRRIYLQNEDGSYFYSGEYVFDVQRSKAVCRGLAFFSKMKKAFASLPCSYVIGSSQPLWASNIEKRYSAFYRELLQDSTTKIDIRRAFRKMQDVFKDQPLKMEEYKGQDFVMMTDGQIFC